MRRYVLILPLIPFEAAYGYRNRLTPGFFFLFDSKFKDEHTFEKRKAEAERIRQKYADRIPVCSSLFAC